MTDSAVFQLASRVRSTSGTASYARLVDTAWRRHSKRQLVTLDAGDVAMDEIPRRASVLVHLGVNDFSSFEFCHRASKSRPDIQKSILVHDPPLFPVSKFGLIEHISVVRAGRGIRRLANSFFGEMLDRRIVLEHDRWITMSYIGKTALEAYLVRLGIRAPRVDVLSHALYGEPFRQSSCDDDRMPLTFGFFGHIAPSKGLETLIDAFNLVLAEQGVDKTAKLRIAGQPDSPHSARLLRREQAKVRRLNLEEHIEFLGGIREDKISDFFRSIDVLALPYLRSNFSASGPLHLSLTYGVPVICSSSPYFSEAVGASGVGLLAKQADPREWADVMSSFIADKSLRCRLAAQVSVAQQRNSWSEMVAHLERVLS